MNQREDHIYGADEEVEPFRIGPGFIAFVLLACLPAIVALVVFFGAWIVADEVKTAEANAAPGQSSEVEGWKSTLIGLCPVH